MKKGLLLLLFLVGAVVLLLALAILPQYHASYRSITPTAPLPPTIESDPQTALATAPTPATGVTQTQETSAVTAAASPTAATLPAAGQAMSPSPSPSAATSPAQPATLPAILGNIKPSETEMLFLIFHLERGRLTLQQAVRTAGNMPLPGTTPLTDGIYHRLVSANGTVLAQSVTADPAIVYHDSPRADGSGVLQGGPVRLESVDFNVRYPVLPGASRIELYQVAASTDVRSLGPKGKEFYGSFPLP